MLQSIFRFNIGKEIRELTENARVPLVQMLREIAVPSLIVVDFESPYCTTLDTPSLCPAMHLSREARKEKRKGENEN